jgi:indolepyruvate ferredoxin oxidoreductase beta subunit
LSAKTHDAALAIAALGGLVKGYGETRHRTTSRLMQILDYLEQSPESDANTIASLHLAAMAPDSRFEIGDITSPAPEPA